MQHYNTMDTKITISSDKIVLLAGNVLEQVQLDHSDFREDHEGGLTFLTIDETMDFYPEDFHNEELLHFQVKVKIEIRMKHDDVLHEGFELENLNAYTLDGTEIYLTKEEEKQAELLIENALIF